MGVDVSIVIVTYNSRGVIDACLESLRSHVTGVSHEVIVVDNASSDGSPTHVERQHPDVRVVRRAKNGGLSAATNDGIAAASGRHVLALNPDTRIVDDAITPLTAYLDAHPDVGVVAPKLLDDDGALQLSCRAFPGYATAVFNRYSLITKLVPGNPYSRDYLLSDFDHATTRDVDWVSGAALMMPRRVCDEVAGWDAGFFMFNEDVDLCRRVRKLGYHVVYLPEAVVYHRIGVSKTPSARMIVERHRSMWRYYRKHLRGNVVQDAVTGAAIALRATALLVAHGLGRMMRRVRSRA